MAEVTNPRQFSSFSARPEQVIDAAAKGIFIEDDHTNPGGLLPVAFMRAGKLANLPTYDDPTGLHEFSLRERNKRAIENSPHVLKSLEERGVRMPVVVGRNDPFSLLHKRRHPEADSPLSLVNGNHRVTWALGKGSDRWVPVKFIDKSVPKEEALEEGNLKFWR